MTVVWIKTFQYIFCYINAYYLILLLYWLLATINRTGATFWRFSYKENNEWYILVYSVVCLFEKHGLGKKKETREQCMLSERPIATGQRNRFHHLHTVYYFCRKMQSIGTRHYLMRFDTFRIARSLMLTFTQTTHPISMYLFLFIRWDVSSSVIFC